MITNFKLYELINNKELVQSTINKSLNKIKDINNGDSINMYKTRSDKLILEIQFAVIIDFKKQVDIEIKKLQKQLKKSGTFLTYKSHEEHQNKMDDDLNIEIDETKPMLESYYLYIKDTHFKRVKPPRFLYHSTPHKNYRSIFENGLEVRSNENFDDTKMYDHPENIYASSDDDFWIHHNKLNDVWKIDTDKLDNKWWEDYNLYNEDEQKKSFLTYEPIPYSALELFKSNY